MEKDCSVGEAERVQAQDVGVDSPMAGEYQTCENSEATEILEWHCSKQILQTHSQFHCHQVGKGDDQEFPM